MLMMMMFAAAVDTIITKTVAAAAAAVVTSAASAVVVVIPEGVDNRVVGKLALSSSATMLKTSPRVVLRSCFTMMYDDDGWLCDMMPRCNVDDAGPLLRHSLLCLEPQMSC